MTLGDLLCELRGNLLRDKSDRVSGADDRLWDDETLVRYIDQAQRRLARRALVIRDNSSDVTRFETEDGTASYRLDPAIRAVLSVRMAGDNQDLPRAGHDALNAYHSPDPLFFDASTLERLPPGKARAWSTDESVLADDTGSFQAINLTLYPVIAAPYDGVTGQLRVIRLPLVRLTTSNLDAVPEVPEDHHLDMLDWAAYLALRGVDTDVAGASAPQRATEFKASFEAHCIDARKDVMRKLFTPQQWGFGRSGWSWES